MKLVIEISDHQYNNIMDVSSVNIGRVPYKGIIMSAINAIKNGTPLPKGHGDLIDRDILANDDRMCDGIACFECHFENHTLSTCKLCNFIKTYPVIIEADKVEVVGNPDRLNGGAE